MNEDITGGRDWRALTVHQPWATLIALGIKPIENRRRPPPRALLGEWVAIHASKTWDDDGAEDAFNLVEFLAGSPPDDDDDVCGRPGGAFEFLDRGDLREPCDFPAGRVVGVARLAAWAEEDGRRSPGLDSRGALGIAMSPWFSGPIGIHLAAAVALPEPVPLRGFRGWPRIRDRRIRADLDALVDPCPFCDRVRGHADECIARDVLSSGGRDELRFEVRGREVTITVRSAESELHFAVPRGVDRLGLRRAWLACLDGVV